MTSTSTTVSTKKIVVLDVSQMTPEQHETRSALGAMSQSLNRHINSVMREHFLPAAKLANPTLDIFWSSKVGFAVRNGEKVVPFRGSATITDRRFYQLHMKSRQFREYSIVHPLRGYNDLVGFPHKFAVSIAQVSDAREVKATETERGYKEADYMITIRDIKEVEPMPKFDAFADKTKTVVADKPKPVVADKSKPVVADKPKSAVPVKTFPVSDKPKPAANTDGKMNVNQKKTGTRNKE